MKALYVQNLREEERERLQKGLRSPSAFTVRRSQILLMSGEEGLKAQEIADRLRCSSQTVREAIHAFEVEGLDCLQKKTRARQDDQRAFDDQGQEWLKEKVRQSPRASGCKGSIWTLKWLAELAAQEGVTEREVEPETVSRALKRAGVNWKRAKHWITSPDPDYEAKKNVETG